MMIQYIIKQGRWKPDRYVEAIGYAYKTIKTMPAEPPILIMTNRAHHGTNHHSQVSRNVFVRISVAKWL